MDSKRHWPSSRTKPMLIWRTFAPVESVTSRNSMGRNARLSRVSVPPMDISVVTSGVSQRTIGRPAGFAVAVALPGTFNSTKRFIKATRAAGASRSKDSLLRAVRYRENPVAFWEHAACKTSRSAAAGLFAATGVACRTVSALGRRHAGQIGPARGVTGPGRRFLCPCVSRPTPSSANHECDETERPRRRPSVKMCAKIPFKPSRDSISRRDFV